MQLTLLLLTALAIASSLGCSSAPSTSTSSSIGPNFQSNVTFKFVDPAGAFEVVLPGKPTQKRQILRVESTDVPTISNSVECALGLFTIAYSDYPKQLVDPTRYEAMLDGAVENSLASSNAKLLIQETITRYGRPGRHLRSSVTYEGITKQIITEFILDGYRMYVLMVLTDPNHVFHDEPAAFFDSFKIMASRPPTTTAAHPTASPQSTSAQATFDEYSIQNFGTILIADIMELQGGKFREFAKQYQEKTGMRVVDSNLATFQQKGVNDLTAEGRTTYARVMVQTIFNQDGEVFKTDELSTMSAKDLSDFDGETKAGTLRDLQAANTKVLAWYGTVVSRIGTYRALHTSYLRQFSTKPSVRVDEYIFFNHDRIHKISISYRLEDKSIWEEPLRKTLNSIHINLVK